MRGLRRYPKKLKTKDDTDQYCAHDAHEVGCYGLVGGVATRTKTGERVHASEVTRAQAPFHCAECLTDAVVRKCAEKRDHFAHNARRSPVIGRGESDLHRKCKEEIRDALRLRYPDGKWECERPIERNKERGTPRVVPDISGRIDKIRVVVEVQASSLTIPKIIKRASAYHALGCAILWIVPLTKDLGSNIFRPRLYERYLHSIFFGRTYYWLPGDGLSLRPVHFGIAHRYIDMSEWYESGGEYCQAGGYEKPYKIVKTPIYGDRVDLADNFGKTERREFLPWNEKKAVPALTIWNDDLKPWWDLSQQQAFEKRYKNEEG